MQFPVILRRAACIVACGWLAAACEESGNAPLGELSSPAPLPALAAEPALPQPQQEAIFNAAGGLLAEATTNAVFSRFSAVQQVQLTPVENRLRVTATGDDPRFLLPAFIQGKQFIIQATVESPADTAMQIYYLRRGQSTYTETQSQTAPLVTGTNTVYFRFEAPDMVDPMRVDIGNVAGAYTVIKMVARVLPSAGP